MKRESYLDQIFDYELTDKPISALGGLSVIPLVAKALGIDRLIDDHLQVMIRNKGYSESELAMAVILTLIAGGESIEDADKIRMDDVVIGKNISMP